MKRSMSARCKIPKVGKGFEDDLKLADTKEVVTCNGRARHLLNLFTAFKGCSYGNAYRKRATWKGTLTTFAHIDKMLSEEEKTTKEEIDDVLFVVSHFRKYGKGTFPGHMVSKHAIDIYHEWLERNIQNEYEGTVDDLKTLEYLASVRGESLEEAFDVLKGSGLFSKEFIESFKGGENEA